MAKARKQIENPTDAYLKIKERKRWQLALRRYVIEGVNNEKYAPYFGLDGKTLRKWFEMQFPENIGWADFASKWQFDHIVPLAYFDFSNEDDLKLCWNFMNLRIEIIDESLLGTNKPALLAIKNYFLDLFQKTNYSLCQRMIDKIHQIELTSIEKNQTIIQFIATNRPYLEHVADLNHEEFNRFNQGVSLEDLLLERELFKKFGM